MCIYTTICYMSVCIQHINYVFLKNPPPANQGAFSVTLLSVNKYVYVYNCMLYVRMQLNRKLQVRGLGLTPSIYKQLYITSIENSTYVYKKEITY